jgi:hypothetical protein
MSRSALGASGYPHGNARCVAEGHLPNQVSMNHINIARRLRDLAERVLTINPPGSRDEYSDPSPHEYASSGHRARIAPLSPNFDESHQYRPPLARSPTSTTRAWLKRLRAGSVTRLHCNTDRALHRIMITPAKDRMRRTRERRRRGSLTWTSTIDLPWVHLDLHHLPAEFSPSAKESHSFRRSSRVAHGGW